MAESTTAAQVPVTPSADPVVSAGLPDTPSSIASSTNTHAVDGGSFLKPANPRKRPRSLETSPALGKLMASTSPRSTLSPLASPLQLTAAAEMAEQKKRKLEHEKELSRQQSPNPQTSALIALMDQSSNSTSRSQDAPSATNTLNAAIASVAPAISIPEAVHTEGSMQTSPTSMSSVATLESVAATTMTANGAQVASPGQMLDGEGGGPENTQPSTPARADTDESHSNKAFTYPGPLLGAQTSDARRGMSLPGSGFGRDDSKSPQSSNKKHKCPYCSTEFTRHHNLKSHLLTHSHEKPYMCQTCDSRFRRLHDLKRHTKLHTGERPHICPKCKRSFARGDALARHNKGQGGCAGRRSSVGSFGGDGAGAGGDDGMDGLLYTGEASHEPENMDDDGEGADDRGQILPSIRRHDAPPDPHYRQAQESPSTYQSRQPSTYPPVAVRQSTGSLYPPGASHGGASSTSTSPGSTLPPHYGPGSGVTSAYQPGGSNAFPHGSMTESPKPLSPGIGQPAHSHPDSGIRRRSPSLTQQFQHQQYGRRPHGHGTPPPAALPPPMSSSGHSNAPHLPSLPGLTPPEPRYTLPSQVGGPSHIPPMAQASYPGPPYPAGAAHQSQPGGIASKSNSHSSHGTQPHGSGERGNLPYLQGEDRIWATVRALENKIDRLQEEVTNLKAQLGVQPHR